MQALAIKTNKSTIYCAFASFLPTFNLFGMCDVWGVFSYIIFTFLVGSLNYHITQQNNETKATTTICKKNHHLSVKINAFIIYN